MATFTIKIKNTYDACGNMTSDCNKGVHSVSYNVLNPPMENHVRRLPSSC